MGLSYEDLVLGTKINVPTIDGSDVRVIIPPFSKVGQDLRLKNKGMKFKNSETRGDMVLELNINMPNDLSDKEKEILENLRKLKK